MSWQNDTPIEQDVLKANNPSICYTAIISRLYHNGVRVRYLFINN